MSVAATGPIVTSPVLRRERKISLRARLLRYLPRGILLDDRTWAQRHKILQIFLLVHLPFLAIFGVLTKNPPVLVGFAMVPIVICLGLGDLAGRRFRRLASTFTTAGIVYCSTILVAFSHGAIEAHFHFFIIVGFIALYQDWVPFLLNILFVVVSHGVGSIFRADLMFNTHTGMVHPWWWTMIHAVAVLLACVGTVLFWRSTEDETLQRQQGEIENHRRQFASELLVNLARRNQSMLYRQLDIINQLEEQERDPDALAELFRIDHLATRIRRNAESLLVLAGEEPPRVWGKPVRLTDVVRASIAETEDLNRVVFVVDERLAILGQVVSDLTHLLAELIENAVRSSPPDTRVTVRSTPDVRSLGAVLLTVEDWGVGMRPEDLAAANEILGQPRDFDAVISKQLGLHVVSRLAHRYDIQVTLTSTSGTGITAVVLLPAEVFAIERSRAGGSQRSFAPIPAPPAAAVPAQSVQSVPAVQSAQSAQSAQSVQSVQAGPAAHPAHAMHAANQTPLAAPIAPAVAAVTGTGGLPLNGDRAQTGPQVVTSRREARRAQLLESPALTEPPVHVDIVDPGPQWDGWWQSDDGELSVRALPSSAHAVAPALAGTVIPELTVTRATTSTPTPPRSWTIPPGMGGTPLVRTPAATPPPAAASSPSSPSSTARSNGTSTTTPPSGRLATRTPQANLAPELQRGGGRGDGEQVPVAAGPVPGSAAASAPDAARAREALSRYQASRQQALAEHDRP